MIYFLLLHFFVTEILVLVLEINLSDRMSLMIAFFLNL